MIFRPPTTADITAVLERYGCSDEVIFNTVRSLDLVETFLELESYVRVLLVPQVVFFFLRNV